MINTDLYIVHLFVARFTARAEIDSNGYTTRCPRCRGWKSGMSIVNPKIKLKNTQKIWPDFINSTHREIVSERVVNDLIQNNISGFDAIKLDCIEVIPKNNRPPMSYYLLSVHGQAFLRPILPNGIIDPTCPECGCWDSNHILSNGKRIHNYPLKIFYWDGQDIANTKFEETSLICFSKRVVELARKKEWTNFQFLLPGTNNIHIQLSNPNWQQLLLIELKNEYMEHFFEYNKFIPKCLTNNFSYDDFNNQPKGVFCE